MYFVQLSPLSKTLSIGTVRNLCCYLCPAAWWGERDGTDRERKRESERGESQGKIDRKRGRERGRGVGEGERIREREINQSIFKYCVRV